MAKTAAKAKGAKRKPAKRKPLKKVDIWSYPSVQDGTAFPEHLINMLWDWLEWARTNEQPVCGHPTSKEQLATFVNQAFQASLRCEEGRPVTFRAAFDLSRKRATVKLKRPVSYKASALVKLAPTIGIGFRWLVVAPSDSDAGLEILGIRDVDISADDVMHVLTRWGDGLVSRGQRHDGWTLSVFGPGAIRINTIWGPIMELRDGAIRMPFSVCQIKYVSDWHTDASASLKLANEAARRVAGSLLRRTWGSILTSVCTARHGGCFLIVPNDTKLSESPLNIKYSLGPNELRNVISERLSVEPALSGHSRGDDRDAVALDDGHFFERDLARMSSLMASLAAVDGAVVVRRDLRLIGFGAEITETRVPKRNEMVKHGTHPGWGTPPEDRPLASFGMRHRSAYRFCESVPGAIAFVASQDGDLRVFCNVNNGVRLFDGPTPEDWVFCFSDGSRSNNGRGNEAARKRKKKASRGKTKN